MPIYEYRCNQCGFEKEHLQKLNSPVLTTCPACGADAYIKLISAAGFQLKGSGWYATDFKNGSGKSMPASTPAATDSSSSTDAPAAACGGSCACHPS
ncbi:FmdB family zinc ribbon protein [Rhodocyclaceae bacterium SMB388]